MGSKVERKVYIDVRKATLKSRRAGVLAVAEAGAGQAAALAPVDKGNLRGSINAKSLDVESAMYGPNVDYAIYPEFGTSKMPAQPFLRPSADWLKRVGGKIYAKVLKRSLNNG